MTSKKICRFLFALPLLVHALVFSVPGFAVIPKKELQLPRGVDLLQEELKGLKAPKIVREVKKSFELLKQEKFKQALSTLGPVKNDKLYGDYGYWIGAASNLGLSRASIAKRQYAQAMQQAKSAISETLQIEAGFPYSPFIRGIPRDIAKAELLMGDAQWGLKKWALAQEYFERAFQRLQGQSALLQVQIGHLSHYSESCKKKEGPSCIAWLQRFSAALPKKSMEMRAILTHFPTIPEKQRLNRPGPRATISYKSPDLDQMAYDTAIRFYFNEKYGDAIKSFEQFLDEYPRSALRFRARYWLAQSFVRKKDPEKGIKVYDTLLNETPLTYYGLLASREAHRSMDGQIQLNAPLAAETDPALTPQDQLRLSRARSFLSERAYALAAVELREIKSQDSLSNPFLLYVAMLNYQARNYRNCFGIIGELIQRGYEGIFSAYGLQMIFPEQNLQLIRNQAKKNNLDPLLVISLIKQESAFDEDVLSSAGATGLMQLMPATATDVDSEVSLSDLRQPENNIRIGTQYLKKLMTRFNGNLVLALASYNAGPYAVDRWIKDFPAEKSMFEFIESIPYKETREYVAAIIRNYYWYSKRIGGPAKAVDIESLWKPIALSDKRRMPQEGNGPEFRSAEPKDSSPEKATDKVAEKPQDRAPDTVSDKLSDQP